ncbi:MAG: hypothetical protein U5N27_21600 [Rhizobium sp.]|nr:hypothetical protein [Rhizobium sp.]
MSTLHALRLSQIDCDTFLARVAEFSKIAEEFDIEMKKGDERDWDMLRTHLANAQLKINDIAVLLEQLERKNQYDCTAKRVIQPSIKCSHLTQLQLGFSLVVMIISGFILLAFYKHLKDQDDLYRQAYFDAIIWATKPALPGKGCRTNTPFFASRRTDCYSYRTLKHYCKHLRPRNS